MKGLLYKEFLSLKKYLNALLLLLILYLGVSIYSKEVSFLAGFSAMAAVIVVFSSFTYDNYANWNCYALSLPLSRKRLVQGRYLFSLITIAVCLLVNLVYGGLILLYSHQPASIVLDSSLAVTGISLLLVSLIIPIAYRFGVDRGRIYVAIIAFCIVAMSTVVQNNLSVIDRLISTFDSFLLFLPLFLALVVLLSYQISYHICQSKEY